MADLLASLIRPDRGPSLTSLDRFAPPPPLTLVVAEVGARSRPGARAPPGAAAPRAALRDRLPVPQGGEALVDEVLDLWTPRTLVSIEAILSRLDQDLRAAPIEAALRLALLHAPPPARRPT